MLDHILSTVMVSRIRMGMPHTDILATLLLVLRHPCQVLGLKVSHCRPLVPRALRFHS